jgi:paraquat-inducible protein B
MFRELAAAARSVRLVADYLERHPEALLKGKAGGDSGSGIGPCST